MSDLESESTRSIGPLRLSDFLPEVAGDRLLVSHAEFERSCKVLLVEEQEKLSPNNAIVSVLCNAVRLSREHCHHATKLGWDANKKLTDALRECARALEMFKPVKDEIRSRTISKTVFDHAIASAQKLLNPNDPKP